jgi:CubicO group peptidase (beta-lactamase class C family)
MQMVVIRRLFNHRSLAAALFAVSLVGAGAPLQEDEDVSGPGEKGPRLIAALEALRREARIPGLSIAVVDHGAVVLAQGLGFADPENRVAATADTPYDIASVTKPLSAVVMLRLVERGIVDLDRPIAEYSDWQEFCEAFREQPSIFARDLHCDPPVHTLRHLFSHTAQGSPGERFSYNPVLFSWASRPIMAVTGVPYSDLVRQHVFEPAGMVRSARRHRALGLPEHLAGDLAPPHRLDDSGSVVRSPRPGPQGDGAAGGIISTVADLARFDIALDAGVLLSPELRALAMTPSRSSSGEILAYGLGWFLQKYGGSQLVWHSGWWEDAYSALYLKVPDRNVTIILLANSEGLWWDNPLDEARVEDSPFARAFLSIWLGM